VSAPANIAAIATAVPTHDVHHPFIAWATGRFTDARQRALFARMAARSGIAHRWSVLPPGSDGGSPVDAGGFYDGAALPATSTRMAAYAQFAPELALQAIAGLGDALNPATITHIIVASCTGMVAPGIDQIIARRLGLSPHVERLLVAFMGCYAGVTALRAARHIVRSEPAARVLLVSVELSTLHLEDSVAIEPLLAMLQFADGAVAAVISAEPGIVKLGDGISLALPDSEELIRWDIGEAGFVMRLSGEVPGRIERALSDPATVADLLPTGLPPHLAIHAGGRSILDAVERALAPPAGALDASRETLRRYGNMSSATILFVIAEQVARGVAGPGLALAFGPGLAAEGIALDFTP
jgi:alpha-pyrone synthase